MLARSWMRPRFNIPRFETSRLLHETKFLARSTKRAAGVQAITTYLRNGMKIGLGSGTTSRWFVRTLGDRIKEGLDVLGAPTSNSTRDLAIRLGVPVANLNNVFEGDQAGDLFEEFVTSLNRLHFSSVAFLVQSLNGGSLQKPAEMTKNVVLLFDLALPKNSDVPA
jgi:DeoR/GlpR family transcriptional regulator of sugar metabolism